jgi:predicted permease
VTDRPRWTTALLYRLAPRGEADDVIGDLEEAHRYRVRRYGPRKARLLTAYEAIELSVALLRVRAARLGFTTMELMQDYKLGLRMLVKYPGLTIAGGLALAIAIGIGAGWYEVTRDVLRPSIPLPGGDRLVEIEMRNLAGGDDERRLLHDLAIWQREVHSIADLGAYRSVERTLTLGDAPPEPITLAEITASAFRLVQVPPLVGRPLLDSDERPGASPVAVLGYDLWRQRFGARAEAIGETIVLGTTTTTIVGVMPRGFAFPVNHRLWVPLEAAGAGAAPLEGPAVRVFGRIAAGSTQAQANAELMTVAARAAADSPQTHERLRPRVLAYGGESPGDRTWLEWAITHLPVLLVLIVACINVGTLVYARTATREAEIATRYALGAARSRIVAQLFVEALVLASVAAVVGLAAAHWAVRWGLELYYAGQNGGPPFWVHPGLRPTTVVYALMLTIAGATLLGVLPGLKATSAHVHAQLRTLGAGGATMRFGRFWTTAMIAQVALTVICLPPAFGVSDEALRDRRIRSQYPAGEYLAIRLGVEGGAAPAAAAGGGAPGRPASDVYGEFERQLSREAGVRAVTFADRLPGMSPAVEAAEAEIVPGDPPLLIPNLWVASVGPRFFETFDVPLVAGRDFTAGDRTAAARAVIVNEAFARRFTNGASPVGRRIRYARSATADPASWFEIVGIVRDIGMTPTDLGEAPYMFTPASAATMTPLVAAVRVTGDPEALVPRVRTIVAQLNASLRLDEVRPLDELVWQADVPMMAGAGAVVAVVTLGLFLSSAGIFSLMSVSVARRTREIGLRTALGAGRGRLIAGIFSRALTLVGSGIAAGNAVLVLFVSLSDEVVVADVAPALLMTSSVMLTVGLAACVEPARRALRIQPTAALKEA